MKVVFATAQLICTLTNIYLLKQKKTKQIVTEEIHTDVTFRASYSLHLTLRSSHPCLEYLHAHTHNQSVFIFLFIFRAIELSKSNTMYARLCVLHRSSRLLLLRCNNVCSTFTHINVILHTSNRRYKPQIHTIIIKIISIYCWILYLYFG